LHASVRKALRQVWELDEADKAERLIRNLARRLKQQALGVAASILEGLDEILTVIRLGRCRDSPTYGYKLFYEALPDGDPLRTAIDSETELQKELSALAGDPKRLSNDDVKNLCDELKSRNRLESRTLRRHGRQILPAGVSESAGRSCWLTTGGKK